MRSFGISAVAGLLFLLLLRLNQGVYEICEDEKENMTRYGSSKDRFDVAKERREGPKHTTGTCRTVYVWVTGREVW
ncbi:hypothetical protein GGR52DRAFT_537392 [Hypoxylon sp. FL1284]|nr:hypothetical protein GGR52DRAFT_537392 [Hypoxylon sp. FL1284]